MLLALSLDLYIKDLEQKLLLFNTLMKFVLSSMDKLQKISIKYLLNKE